MNLLSKSLLAVMAMSVSVMLPLSGAYAGGPPPPPHKHYGKWHKAPYPRWGPRYGPRPYWYGPRAYYGPPGYYYGDDAVALGVLGLATGAIIGGAIVESNRPGSYNNPLPAPSAPPPAGYRTSGPVAGAEPWSDEWYRYCANKYRSFDATRGTYRGYDGRDHFCVVR